MTRKYTYPFTAVLGQEKLKKALVLNIINPRIKGVLLSGEKGTAKSTLVRGLAAALKDIQVVELPLNTTEDRLLGSIDLERALQKGEKSFEPGILAKANGQILYVDEVNLLSEHLVHALLDTAQSGINYVEREGVSFSHEADFILVGTMNPEEGALGAQFLDRFGLYAEAVGEKEITKRMEIVARRLEYEKNPDMFTELYAAKTEEFRAEIVQAQNLLPQVKVTEAILQLAAQMVNQANCAGHRGELILIEAARALAALAGREYVNLADLKEAAPLALTHRKRKEPEGKSVPPNEQQEEEQKDNSTSSKEQTENDLPPNIPNKGADDSSGENDESPESQDNQNDESAKSNQSTPDNDNPEEDIVGIGDTFQVVPWQTTSQDRLWRQGNGRRSKSKTWGRQGRYIAYRLPQGKVTDLAFDATLRIAAPYQKMRHKPGQALVLKPSDLREKVREKRVGNTLLFLVDASGSMGAQERMKATKGAIVSLLTDAYQKRDNVGLIAFRKTGAELLLDITRSVDLAEKKLQSMPTGGRTPLAAGLELSYQVLKARKLKDPEMIPVLILLSDGRANFSATKGDPLTEAKELATKIAAEGIRALVVDTEKDVIELGLAKELAQSLTAQYYKLEELDAERMVTAVKSYLAI